MKNYSCPICVDLDGTLIRTDSLYELFLRLVFEKPWRAFSCLMILFLKGIAPFKKRVAHYTNLDKFIFPYNTELFAFLEKKHKEGRELILVTAADEKVANYFSTKTGLFSSVMASQGEHNFNAHEKLKVLLDRYGEKGFDYIGNDVSDLIIFFHARNFILVNASKQVIRKVKKIDPSLCLLDRKKKMVSSFLREIRIHQLFKNALIFIPLLLGQFYINIQKDILVLLAFIFFSCATSSVYLLNDLVDLHTDRVHHRKKLRPIAAGNFSLPLAFWLTPVLAIIAFVGAYFIQFKFFLILLCYYFLTFGYSFFFKKMAIVDVFTLALLYTLRVLAGGFSICVAVSPWLLSFSLFFFLGLAYMKRYSELYNLRYVHSKKMVDKNYHAEEDLYSIMPLGIASNFISVLVLALYINSNEVKLLYKYPSVLWLAIIVVLYFINRLWFLAAKGQMSEDPIVFLLKDKQSTFLFFITLIVILISNHI